MTSFGDDSKSYKNAMFRKELLCYILDYERSIKLL